MPLNFLPKGDVVFTSDAGGTLMHKVITQAQAFGTSPGHTDSVHVAVATGDGLEVIESVGGGLQKRKLAPGKFRLYSYRGQMYREIREIAVFVAEEFYSRGLTEEGFGDYNKRKAALSTLRSPSRGANTTNPHNQQFGAGAKAHSRFFCSNFVFRCFAAASEAAGLGHLAIPDSHAQISPRDLEGLILKTPHWHPRREGVRLSNR